MKRSLLQNAGIIFIVLITFCIPLHSQSEKFNGLNTNLETLPYLSDAVTRSISPENPTGEKGKGGMATLENGSAKKAARDLGQGWKVNPYIHIQPGETAVIAEIDGPGAIQHIWFTPSGNWRFTILRIYWDDEEDPSVEVPVGDFCAAAYGYHPITSLAMCLNPSSAFNSYWVMPFKKKCKITMENIGDKQMALYYQIDYTLTDVPKEAAYFHAQFRRVNPLQYKQTYTIVDSIVGEGQYVGTVLNWQTNNNGWWGEGEIKFYIDGDTEFPTICGTGTEDYFCGSYGFVTRGDDGKQHFNDVSTPYTGFYEVKSNEILKGQPRYEMYRWHIVDPIRFKKNLRVEIQALGWQSGGRYLPLRDDISSVAFWYQKEPHHKFPPLPSRDELDIQ